jgi:hypothetical protein
MENKRERKKTRENKSWKINVKRKRQEKINEKFN